MLTFKAPINLKDGTTIPKGAKVSITWNNLTQKAHINYEGRDIVVGSSTAGKALAGKIPSEKSIENWFMDSVCKTPTGKTVEPDGVGSDGVPSWLMILGLI